MRSNYKVLKDSEGNCIDVRIANGGLAITKIDTMKLQPPNLTIDVFKTNLINRIRAVFPATFLSEDALSVLEKEIDTWTLTDVQVIDGVDEPILEVPTVHLPSYAETAYIGTKTIIETPMFSNNRTECTRAWLSGVEFLLKRIRATGGVQIVNDPDQPEFDIDQFLDQHPDEVKEELTTTEQPSI